MIIADAATGIAALGIVGIPILFLIGCLYFFFPLIVMFQLSGIKGRMDKARMAKEQSDASDIQANAALLSAQTEIYKELKTQNALSRQLLKAYGHEPES